MALNKGEGAGTIYLSVSNGKLVRQVKEKTTESTERTNKVGKIVHEEFFKDLVATLVKVDTKENDYGKQWQLHFKDGDDKYLVQMPFSSRYSSSFLKVLPNIQHDDSIRFMPWQMQDKNDASKSISGITVYHDDGNGWVKIAPAFTKEEPNGLPQMKKIKVKGKETWDDSEMMDFLEQVAKDWNGTIPAPTDEQAKDEPAPF